MVSDVCPYCRGNKLAPPKGIRLYYAAVPGAYVKVQKFDLTDYDNVLQIHIDQPMTVVGVGMERSGVRCLSQKLSSPRPVLLGDTLSVRGWKGCNACGDQLTASAAMLRKIQGYW